jgi:hypothetical protein
MAEPAFDFAVFGSTPLAGLVAGLLAAEHNKRVCLVGESWSPFRLPRSYDVSVAPATRPETWALLNVLSVETMKLLATLGTGLTERLDPLTMAETTASINALLHMRHMAAGYGYAAERVADASLANTGLVLRLRDVAMLVDSRAGPAIGAWLDRLGVRRLAPEATGVVLRRDGTARLSAGAAILDAAQTVLADDSAILSHLDPDERDRALHQRRVSVVLSEPAKPLASPLMSFLDRDVVLLQHGKGGGILALAGGPVDDAMARIGACIGSSRPLKRVGQASFRTLVTTDGAPLVGPAKGLRAIVVAGFGATGAFFAPALARHLAGAASETEKAYLAAREPSRGNARQSVADYVRPDVLAVTA